MAGTLRKIVAYLEFVDRPVVGGQGSEAVEGLALTPAPEYLNLERLPILQGPPSRRLRTRLRRLLTLHLGLLLSWEDASLRSLDDGNFVSE